MRDDFNLPHLLDLAKLPHSIDPAKSFNKFLAIGHEMKDFSNASFPPETINIMKIALDAAVASLPEPVNSVHVQSIAETILRSAKEGERDPVALQRLALLESSC